MTIERVEEEKVARFLQSTVGHPPLSLIWRAIVEVCRQDIDRIRWTDVMRFLRGQMGYPGAQSTMGLTDFVAEQIYIFFSSPLIDNLTELNR